MQRQDNIKTVLSEIGSEEVSWTEIAKDTIHWWTSIICNAEPSSSIITKFI
jgi:hypothetical protein